MTSVLISLNGITVKRASATIGRRTTSYPQAFVIGHIRQATGRGGGRRRTHRTDKALSNHIDHSVLKSSVVFPQFLFLFGSRYWISVSFVIVTMDCMHALWYNETGGRPQDRKTDTE